MYNFQRIYADFNRLITWDDEAITITKALGETLLQRLFDLDLQPSVILDLGAGSGTLTTELAQRYPQSTVIALDYAFSRAQQLHHSETVCAAGEALPFADHSVDVVFCHMMLHWCDAPELVLQEVQRILKPEGVFLFSVFAPDTLKELKQVLGSLSDKPTIAAFSDMHNWGDLLQSIRFKNPVVDVDYFSLYYRHFAQLMLALRRHSPTYFLQNMNKGLITPRQWQQWEVAYEAYRDEHGLAATLEIVYGIAFGVTLDDSAAREASIPVQQVRRKQTNNAHST